MEYQDHSPTTTAMESKFGNNFKRKNITIMCPLIPNKQVKYSLKSIFPAARHSTND